ncbi:hypothetical protein G9A89_003034 [Geosiphon pyriformis]|nr:hypothetical protein G9A89_003034 [Geosiphon pyriformis]
MTTAYIAKIPEFTGEDNNTSSQKWLDKVQKARDANEELFENWQAFKNAFLQQFTDNNTSITLCNHFCNIKQETSETVMTYLRRFNKLLCQIQQLETNNYYSNAQILDQFIAELKDKLIKKVCPHAPADLATAIKHAKNYEMTIEEANHTKFTNSQKRLRTTLQTNNNSSNNHKDINHHNNATKTILDLHLTTNLKIVIIVKSQDTGNKIAENYRETNKTELHNQFNNNINNLYQFSNIRYHSFNNIKYQPENWFNITNSHQNQFQNNNNKINPNNQLQRPIYYHIQSNYLTMPEESNFQQPALFKDIFPFEFEANESPFLLSNTAVNEQKTITAIYTEAEVERKPIQLILDSGSAGTQTVIVTADNMKKTPVGEINNFPFTIDGITIPVKVLVMNALQYQAFIKNDWLFKTNTNLDWEIQKLKISYQGQYTRVPATCGTFNKKTEKAPVFKFEEKKELPATETFMALGLPSNWAEETEQEIFEEIRE